MIRPADDLLLDVDDLTVKFGEFTAVSGVAFDVSPGQVVGIIGPNGAGKSTLINTLFGINKPSGGSIRSKGRDIRSLRPDQRARSGFSRTFQNLELFSSMTVFDNVLTHLEAAQRSHSLRSLVGSTARASANRATVHEILEDLRLGHLAYRQTEELAYAERKLVEFARAMVADVQIVLLDEPVAGVALEERQGVVARVREHLERRNVAAIIVEHDMSVIRALCSVVHVLDSGSLIASGTFEHVMAHPRVREAYLG